MIPIFENETAALDEDAIFFELSGPARLTCDGFIKDEFMTVLVEKVGGGYQPMTCDHRTIVLKRLNNTVYLPGPGKYSLRKTLTANGVSAGYTE